MNNMNVSYNCGTYAPYIKVEFDGGITKSDLLSIYDIAEDESIKKIYIKGESKLKDNIKDALQHTEITQYINSDKSAGSGIVIGILEGNGIVDVKNSNFAGASIKIMDHLWVKDSVTEHATKVAAVAHAAAPGAKLLSAYAYGTIDDEIEWMLDNGVNIINMSFSDSIYESDYGEYSSSSAYCDYIARTSWVTFVGAAGNEGEKSGKVTEPNGYNMVTVGACNGATGKVSSFSSYKENYNINHPNIVAPGIGYAIPTYSDLVQGTSFSAPLVSGAVAVLMQKAPVLKTCPESVLSILMSSAKRIDAYALGSGFHDKAGTGMLNLENAVNVINKTVRFSKGSDSVGSYVSSKSVYLKAGQRIRVAFVSLINNDHRAITDLATDYDLYLFNNNGAKVAVCSGTHNNEFIDYKVPTTGYYTIRIKQYAAKKTSLPDYCSYSYCIE